MMPFFSIIIPVYNVAPYLRECLDSVLAQTFTDWEAICVDDGSTDGSGAILDEYAAKDERFRLIHQKNAGVSVARNAGLDVAIGEFVAFVDADDLVGNDWLSSLRVAIAEHPSVDWVRTCFSYIDEKNKVYVVRNEKAAFSHCANSVPIAIWRSLATQGEPWLNVIRRNIIGSVRFPVGVKWREDTCFSSRVVPFAKQYLITDNIDYHYRAVDGSASRRKISFETVRDVLKYMSDAWVAAPGERESITTIFRQCIRSVRSSGVQYKPIEWRGLRRVILASKAAGAFDSRLIPFKLRLRWRLFLLIGREWVLKVNRVSIVEWVKSSLRSLFKGEKYERSACL